MISNIRTTAVIARRDFHATVISRTFLLFLIAPLFPIIFGMVFGAVGAKMDVTPSHAQVLAISADPETMDLVTTAHEQMQAGEPAIPMVGLEPVELLLPDSSSIRALLRERPDLSVLLIISNRDATLYGDGAEIKRIKPYVTLLLGQTERQRVLTRAGIRNVPSANLITVPFGAPPKDDTKSRPMLGQVSQTLLFVLTLMLAGVLLSNFIEEKGNKVIEVLAAAAPMPAIFTGKLFAMLGSSLVGVMVWTIAGVTGFVLLSHQGLASLPVPAVGWPVFATLAFLYFSTNYLLVGALLLGIGAQAASVRQIQTISLPITMAQLVLYGLASAALNQPYSPIALFAAMFPYSSPLTMIAYAAREPVLWPHIAALLWQALWVMITIVVTAGWFKRGVLKSGPARPIWPWRRNRKPA